MVRDLCSPGVQIHKSTSQKRSASVSAQFQWGLTFLSLGLRVLIYEIGIITGALRDLFFHCVVLRGYFSFVLGMGEAELSLRLLGEFLGEQLHADDSWMPPTHPFLSFIGQCSFLLPDRTPAFHPLTPWNSLRSIEMHVYWAWCWKPGRQLQNQTWKVLEPLAAADQSNSCTTLPTQGHAGSNCWVLLPSQLSWLQIITVGTWSWGSLGRREVRRSLWTSMRHLHSFLGLAELGLLTLGWFSNSPICVMPCQVGLGGTSGELLT